VPNNPEQEQDREMEDISGSTAPPAREKRETPIIVKYPSNRAGEEITDKSFTTS
jgi:hypothetical protein